MDEKSQTATLFIGTCTPDKDKTTSLANPMLADPAPGPFAAIAPPLGSPIFSAQLLLTKDSSAPLSRVNQAFSLVFTRTGRKINCAYNSAGITASCSPPAKWICAAVSAGFLNKVLSNEVLISTSSVVITTSNFGSPLDW